MALSQRIGVYPGTFDPLTLGHLDIIRRGAHLVDRLVIGVTTNPAKSPMFSVAERIAMVKRELADMASVSVRNTATSRSGRLEAMSRVPIPKVERRFSPASPKAAPASV